MELRWTLTRRQGGRPDVDVVVRARPGTPFGAVRADLLAATGTPPGPVWVAGRPVADDDVLGAPPLTEGALLVTGTAPDDDPATAWGLRRDRRGLGELHVVEGPDAGLVHLLRPGTHRVGRAADADLRLTDPDVSRQHLVLEVSPQGVLASDVGSANGTAVDGVAVGDAGARVRPGARLRLGSTTLVVRAPEYRVAVCHPTGEGTVEVGRAPRVVPALEDVALTVPAEPAPPEHRPVPWLTALLPLAVSIPMALLWSPFALLLGLTSPVLVLGSVVSDRRGARRTHRAALERYERELADVRRRAQEAVAAESRRRRLLAPDAPTLAVAAGTPSVRLWERRPGDADDLLLRVGTGRARSRVRLKGPDDLKSPDDESLLSCPDVPVAVPLADLGVVGMAGGTPDLAGVLRFAVLGLAVLQTPRDTSLWLVCPDRAAGRAWAWARWLPHVPAAVREHLDGARDAGAVVEELRAEVAGRRQAPSGSGPATWSGRRHVVVLDGYQALAQVPGVTDLLRDGPAVGVLVVCRDTDPAGLPIECTATVEAVATSRGRLRVRLATDRPDVIDTADPDDPDDTGDPIDTAGGGHVVADVVSTGWAHAVARSLAPLRDGTSQDGPALPDSVSLVDLLRRTGTDPLDAEAVAAVWSRSSGALQPLIGAGTDGPLAPDLRVDGPHALVGGTTGAGKSELLRTLLASLAATVPPDELTFLLIDYKGGSAFAECADLPHTVGLVTDLDEHLTRRALVALGAEVRRRERLLREAGARDLDGYRDLPDRDPLPRLMIVVDEFRVLADELPDFVAGLVRLAAVGRSLGLHLVLATQRPAGVVTPDIAANVNLRIALRVRDRSDSVDVVEAPDAAAIDPRRPGRGVLRTGAGSLVPFQSAHVGGRAEGADDRPQVRLLDAGCAGQHDRPGQASRASVSPPGPSDLARIVAAVSEAAARSGRRAPSGLWLPPLPEVLTPEDVAAAYDPATAHDPATTHDPAPAGSHPAPEHDVPALVLGLGDSPQTGTRPPVTLPLRPGTALAVIGAPRSGRTGTVLAAAQAAAGRPHGTVHLYVVAGPDAALQPLRSLPHTAALLRRDDPDLLGRLATSLLTEVRRRRQDPAPASPLVLLVDGWDVLVRELEAADRADVVDDLLHVVREGPAVAVSSVVTGERALTTGRAAGAFTARLLLRTSDPADAVLAGADPSALPSRMPPGRGLWLTADRSLEVQVLAAAAWPDPQVERDPAVSTDPAAGTNPHPPFRLRALPDEVAVTDLDAAPGVEVPVGVGGDDARVVGLSRAQCRRLLVAGPPGSGRSTALAVLARQLDRPSRRVVVLAPPDSPAATTVPTDAVVSPGDVERLRTLLAELGPEVTVLVDEARDLDTTGADDLLARHLAAGGGVVVAGDPGDLAGRFRGTVPELRRGRTGLLLCPTGYADGDALGVRVPRAVSARPGRGWLVQQGRAHPVQVADLPGVVHRGR